MVWMNHDDVAIFSFRKSLYFILSAVLKNDFTYVRFTEGSFFYTAFSEGG